jgi:hypothetical protein
MRDGDLELRRFGPADAEALDALLAEPEVKSWWRDSAYDRDNGWVAEVAGEFAGWVQYEEEPYEWYPSPTSGPQSRASALPHGRRAASETAMPTATAKPT